MRYLFPSMVWRKGIVICAGKNLCLEDIYVQRGPKINSLERGPQTPWGTANIALGRRSINDLVRDQH